MQERRVRRLFMSLGLLFLLTVCACGGLAEGSAGSPLAAGGRWRVSASTTPVRRMAGDIDRYVTRLTADGSFSGVVLVVYRGTLVLGKGYGWADQEQGAANGLATRFRIASLTKSFTAMAVLLLEAEGRLHTADPVCAYLSPCPGQWRGVTLHHLLTHTSGIPDYVRTPGFFDGGLRQHTSGQRLLALVADAPLLAEPGSRFAYSSSNYLVLGLVIARVVDPTLPVEVAYERYLEERIFAPLRMESTGTGPCEAGSAGLATGYIAGGQRAMVCDPSNFFAMGDLYATAPDLYRWGEALANDRLLAAPAQDRMFAPYVATPQYRTSYGYGWYLTQLEGSEYFWHEGAAPGYRAYFRRERGEDTLIIILSNYEVAPVLAMGQEIGAVLIRRGKDALL